MIEVVVKFDSSRGLYAVYEPTTETLFLTASLGESFLSLSKFLQEKGMIEGDLLSADNIEYHIDSACFSAMVKSNANLLKRLNQAPSGFTISSQRFGGSMTPPTSQPQQSQGSGSQKKRSSGGTFSKTGFKNSYKKFGGNNL